MSAATAPRSRSCAVALICTIDWMSYWLTIALPIVRVKLAMPPSTCGAPVPLEPLIGMFASAGSESSRYCGVCITIGYETPFCGFSQ